MSGLISPRATLEETAYALLIELVRAQRVSQYEDETSGPLTVYDEAVRHFKEKKTERQAWISWYKESVTPVERAQALTGQQFTPPAATVGRVSVLTKQQRDMRSLILLRSTENGRNHREEHIHILAFKMVTGFRRHFINPRLHILRLRIERFNPPIGTCFIGGDMLPALPLLFIQPNLHPR